MFPPLLELAGVVAIGCTLIVGFISIVAAGEDYDDKVRKGVIRPEPPKATPRPAPPAPKKSMLPAMLKPLVEPKLPALVLAETFAEPIKTEFALPVAQKLAAMKKATNTFSNVKEAPLVAAVTQIIADATSVLGDYANIKTLGGERRLPLKRIVDSTGDVLRTYGEYRVWAVGARVDLDLHAIENVVSEFQSASQSIAALRTDHKKDALNSLAVELHVLRDVTRR